MNTHLHEEAVGSVDKRIKALRVQRPSDEVYRGLVADEAARLRVRYRGLGLGAMAGGLVMAGMMIFFREVVFDQSKAWMQLPAAITLGTMMVALAVDSWRRVPPASDPAKRVARTRSVSRNDYLHPGLLWLTRLMVGLAVLGTVIALGLSVGERFDAGVLLRGGGPIVTLVAVIALIAFEVLSRRSLELGAHASTGEELFWADARRAILLEQLSTPASYLGYLGVLLTLIGLDPAASAATRRLGDDPPDWVVGTLMAGYTTLMVITLAMLVLMLYFGFRQRAWFAQRLWRDRAEVLV